MGELKRNGHFEETQIAAIMYQLLLSVFYYHIDNIIHRDLNPENYLLEGRDKNGFYINKIINFGSAKKMKKKKI